MVSVDEAWSSEGNCITDSIRINVSDSNKIFHTIQFIYLEFISILWFDEYINIPFFNFNSFA